MRRFFMWCAALNTLVLAMSLMVQTGWAQPAPQVHNEKLKGTYAFTLSEKCVQQLNYNNVGFDSNFNLVDPSGAETYGGASDGLMVFDGKGNVSIEQGRATNIMNASNRLIQPTPPTTLLPPLGFGLGPALPFSCNGKYTVTDNPGKALDTVLVSPLTCNATLTLPNAFNSTGFQSTFRMEGYLPQNQDQLLLTDIGNTVQPVTIFFPGGPPAPSVMQYRICTRSTNLVLVAPN